MGKNTKIKIHALSKKKQNMFLFQKMKKIEEKKTIYILPVNSYNSINNYLMQMLFKYTYISDSFI